MQRYLLFRLVGDGNFASVILQDISTATARYWIAPKWAEILASKKRRDNFVKSLRSMSFAGMSTLFFQNWRTPCHPETQQHFFLSKQQVQKPRFVGLLSDHHFFQAILEQKREAELEEVNKAKKATVSSFVARSERGKFGCLRECKLKATLATSYLNIFDMHTCIHTMIDSGWWFLHNDHDNSSW